MDDLTLSARPGGDMIQFAAADICGMIHTLASAISRIASAGFADRKAVSIAGV
jgi:hypothetical protein